MREMIDVFICTKCGYEDSSLMPMKKDLEVCECPECKETVPMHIVEMEHGENMTFSEYIELVKYIVENHSFRRMMGKRIKYISHTLDFRTGEIHRIVLDGVEFAKVNQNRHRNLVEWVYNYLNK